MPSTVHCPSCSRELRVPDELIGKKVKCPACSTTFTASIAPEAAAPAPEGASEGLPAQPRRPPPDGAEEGFAEPRELDYGNDLRSRSSRQRALSKLRAPAICLLVVGILGVLAGLIGLVSRATSNPQQMKEAFKDMSPQFREAFQKGAEFESSGAGLVFRLGLLLLSVVVVVGAIMMLVGRMYWLAMTSSILAMLNPTCCCCLLGIPFGIWSIVVLSSGDVKAAFD